MADRELTLIAKRDDGAYLLRVPASPCVLTVAEDDDGQYQVWANHPDAAAARGNWQQASGEVPEPVMQAAAAFVARPDWCPVEA